MMQAWTKERQKIWSINPNIKIVWMHHINNLLHPQIEYGEDLRFNKIFKEGQANRNRWQQDPTSMNIVRLPNGNKVILMFKM
jgi:hypothetical protein